MKRKLYFLFYLISCTAFAQQIPKVTLADDKELTLTDLKVQVEIVGNLAVTTYDMKFYNKMDRTMEGELVFPLGEGQVVSGFSMDVNGKMRDAVIVEKELARVAYETTIRQRIDPGLLEKTAGNNYKARVYPIFPESHKHIILKFEQELSTYNGIQTYELPLGISEKLDNFSAAISVFGDQQPMVSKTSYKDIGFTKNNTAYTATVQKHKHAPKKPIVVQIPNKKNQERLSTYNGYFQYYKALAPVSRLKEEPETISILWDASYSMRHKNIDDELKLLSNYLEYIGDVKVKLFVFNNRIQATKDYEITNGNSAALIAQLKNVIYDGGTALNLFKNTSVQADEILLFSDGLQNLGDFSLKGSIPVYAINSLVSSNHQNLRNITTNSGGNYINMTRVSVSEAMKLLKEQTYQFLGIQANEDVYEVYPATVTNVYHDFAITGRFTKSTTLELLFGYGGEVLEKIPVRIEKKHGTTVVKRLWAKQKLIDLNRDKKANRQKIISLGKRYDLITDYTSMLILDRIDDYVRYRIEPPAELMAQYKTRLTNIDIQEARKKRRLVNQRKNLYNGYQSILTWYNTDVVAETTKKPSSESTTSSTLPQIEVPVQTETRPTTTETVENPSITNTIAGTISGKVTDESGMPLPGATVNIRGASEGVTTDFDGNYTLQAVAGNVVEFNYVGYLPMAHTVRVNDRTLNMEMKLGAELEEVTVVAYGKTRRRQAVASAVTVVRAESIEDVPNAPVSKILRGQAGGLNISGGSGQPGASGEIVLRGRNSISDVGEPLYVVDGVPVDKATFESLDQSQIQETSVIKDLSSSGIYGNRGANGAVVVTTKNGAQKKKEAIEAFEEEVAKAITMQPWDSNQPYIEVLDAETTVAAAYEKYIEIRASYANTPTFYLDVADFFNERNATEIAVTVITNLMEIELDNYELLKAVAYKLEYFNRYDMAVHAYKKVLELRPEEPHSYRDLALAYEHIGEYQKSYDLLFKICDGQLLEKDEAGRFSGIEKLVYVELSRLVALHGDKINLTEEMKKRFAKMPTDVRITIDWNHNETDIDLWVYDPDGEKASYQNTKTKIGGRMSRDLTQGYGPEEFMLKNAINGEYQVYVHYYADRVQKISGPAILKVTLYKNYGTKNEQKEIAIVRLSKDERELEVGSLFFKK